VPCLRRHALLKYVNAEFESDVEMGARVSLSSFPGALHCAGDSMDSDLRTYEEMIGTRCRLTS